MSFITKPKVVHPGLPRTRDKDSEKLIKRAGPFN